MNKKLRVSFIYGIFCVIIFMLFVYSNDTSSKYNKDVKEIKAKVTKVDDSNVVKAGVSAIGFQELEVVAINSEYKGKSITVQNQLLGKLDYDNYYKVGDKIIAAVKVEDNKIIDAKAVELYRQNYLLIIFLVFVILLIIYARSIGIKALLSFLCTLFVLWKFLIPNLLQGRNPLLIAFVTLFVLSGIILFTVAGLNKKGISAFLGTISGLLITLVLTIIVGDKLGLMGMTSPYAETIVFSGYFDLNMLYIFYVSIIIGSSGAAMDIAMDVSSACQEIKTKKEEITQKELIKSGFNVGRDVIGTMTTTLLLAYSGGYLTLLMLFQIRDSSFTRIINMKIIAAEIMRTLIGSIGLIIVAPITAIIAGVLMGKKIYQ
ncbi:membrane protein [Vallitalea longa]|uniref:Membrane protein n=1 Tax=Vallitalea longa TaxID=2936439 RepID=A0A9W6DF26_9FIRM|nr:YibE/F family protein [Vallitalea longa]GKX28234.1 membrane protein [Vallitalea longa]